MEKKETNFIHYQEEILPILHHGFTLAFNYKENKCCACHECSCSNCLFYDKKEEWCDHDKRGEWVAAEYQHPKPKLTKLERWMIDGIIEDFYIERDKELYLCFMFCGDVAAIELDGSMFSFIKPDKAWTKKELLSLEVE